ncbi:flavodoxin domain-containing protein [Bacillaceae bacterium Marseille-Q3522]|nr:flavodoxin domain-containing protein [Bacillaceae bacterium Marseille-Q3522]
MKTVIIYASKHGFTKNCAETLKEKLLGEVDLFRVKEVDGLALTEYDHVIIGSPVYMGQINKGVKQFCLANEEVLKKKKIGLFLCGLTDLETAPLEFPKVLVHDNLVKGIFGGEVKFQKLNFFEKFIMKHIGKTNQDKVIWKKENIEKFAGQMNVGNKL